MQRTATRTLLGGLAATLGLLVSSQALAVDEEAAKALAKEYDCFKCHAPKKAKKGPSYQKIAAKYQGKADAVDKMTKHLLSSPKVKLEDGTEEEHKAMDNKDPKAIRNLVDWILTH